MFYLIGLDILINTWRAFFYSYTIKIPRIFWYKILITMFFIFIYRIGTYIPVPGINTIFLHEILRFEISNFGLFNHIDFLMGGSLGRISIFSLNLIPYLSANLFFNLLLSSNKFFKGMVKNKEVSSLIQGITLIIATVQSYGILLYLEKVNERFYKKIGLEILASDAKGLFFTISTILTLVVSTLILQWIAQKITNYGIGNGITVILVSGILAEISKSVWGLSLISKVVICLTFLAISYVILAVEQTSILIPVSKLQSYSLWYEKQNYNLSYITIPMNLFGLTPLIIYQVLSSFALTFTKELVLFKQIEIINYFFIQAILLGISCLVVRSILINNLSKKEILYSIKKQMLAFHGFRLGKEVSNYLNTLINSLVGINFLYFLFIYLIPEVIFNSISNFYALDDYHLNGITIFLIVKVMISILRQIKILFLFDISKQIGRKETISAFLSKKNKKMN